MKTSGVSVASKNSALKVWLYALDDLGGHAIGACRSTDPGIPQGLRESP
jgi:hypothetical protein